MASMTIFSGTCSPRWATPETLSRRNLAPWVERAALLLGFRDPARPGFPLMPHQDLINRVTTEMLPDGRFAYRQVVIELMRQQGKSVDVLSMMVARAMRRPDTQISYTAQTRIEARHRLLDKWWPRLERSRLYKRGKVRCRRGSGSEAYVFRNGSMISLFSPTETGGHGDTLHVGVIDEAWAQEDARVEQAMRPAMMTVPDAQLWIVSAAGNERSAYFRAKVEDGRARAQLGVTDTGCYIGFGAPADMDPGAEETWRAVMPALGRTVSVETVRADFELMELAEFRRAYLCQWPEVAKPGWETISKAAWDAAADPGAR